MAVVVEISKTEHLTYSPLNEKHNVLYNKTRHIFNQRFIQKPWFDLNPFLDVAERQNQDLENFVPDDYKGVQPLQSLCIVEDFFSDKPHLTKEFGIGEFWDFLFSNNWADGYSIRVLEGSLHHMIVSTLVHLTKSGEVVQHSTLAYAKNKRPRLSVYKHTKASKGQNLGCNEETLLLDFIYYGHAVNRESESSSIGYAGSSTTFPYASAVSEEIDSSDHEQQDGQNTHLQENASQESLPDIHPPTDKSRYSKVQQKRFRKRIHYSEHVQTTDDAEPSVDQAHSRQTINKTLSRQTMTRSVSRVKDQGGGLPTIPESGLPHIQKEIPRQETLSNFSSGSDYRHVPSNPDLKKFMCTESISYLGEFDIGSDSSSESEDDENYGQEFYLGDLRTSDKTETVEMMLKRRKDLLAKLRADWRKKMNEYKPHKSMLPVLSELEISKYLSDETLKRGASKRLDSLAVPDLDEYIKMLRADEKFDPSLGPAEKQKIRKIAKKYNLIKPESERFGDVVGGITDSVSCKMHCYDRDPSWRTLKDSTKRNYMIAKLMKAGGKVYLKKKKKRKERKKAEPMVIPLLYITTTSGITYLHPLSKGILQRQRKTKDETKTAPGPRVSLLPSSPTALKQVLTKRRKKSPPTPVDSSKDGLLTVQATGPKFPKATLVTGEESPDEDSDEESDELSDSPFDTTKLNVKYSIEKLRSKRAKKKKKGGKFQKVLKKYYQMQSILKAFTPKPQSRRASLPAYPSQIVSGIPTMKSKRKSMKMRPTHKEEEETSTDKITVGKLKRFRFLNARDKPKPPEETFTEDFQFAVYRMEDFRHNIERALEEFVVRREIVVSNISSKASVSITFTKKSVFTKSRFPNV